MLNGWEIVLLARDFRQTLLVFPWEIPAIEVRACIKSFYLWPNIKAQSSRVDIEENLKGDIRAERASSLLLQNGNGKI